MKQMFEDLLLKDLNPTFHAIMSYILDKIEMRELEKRLAKNHSDINSQVTPSSVLHMIAAQSKSNEVLPIIEKYLDYSVFKCTDKVGQTPLRLATLIGTLANMETLIEFQIRHLKKLGNPDQEIRQEIVNVVNIKNFEQRTALHAAADSHSVEKINFLLSLGADTTIIDKFGETPLDSAADSTFSPKNKAEAMVSLIKGVTSLHREDTSHQSFVERILTTQRPGNSFQEQELLRAANKATGITSYCTIS